VHPVVVEVFRSPALSAYVAENARRYEPLVTGLKLLREAQFHPSARRRVRPTTRLSYTLRLHTLGEEYVERDGRRIPASEWRATRAREMFLFLLFQGRQARERICLAFWPDSPPSRVRQNFHTTLYRIRRAMGDNVVSFDDNVYMINPDLETWCDAIEMERMTAQARLLPARDARTEDLWRRAVELYQGEFLPSLDADWIMSRREALEQTYMEALYGLGECTRVRGDYRGAISVYKRALGIDPYREDIHRAVLICYAQLGEKKQIQVHLRDMQDLFLQELSVRPSPETFALAATLLR
jgi:DNA-binding SARP family transcriptional activator